MFRRILTRGWYMFRVFQACLTLFCSEEKKWRLRKYVMNAPGIVYWCMARGKMRHLLSSLSARSCTETTTSQNFWYTSFWNLSVYLMALTYSACIYYYCLRIISMMEVLVSVLFSLESQNLYRLAQVCLHFCDMMVPNIHLYFELYFASLLDVHSSMNKTYIFLYLYFQKYHLCIPLVVLLLKILIFINGWSISCCGCADFKYQTSYCHFLC